MKRIFLIVAALLMGASFASADMNSTPSSTKEASSPVPTMHKAAAPTENYSVTGKIELLNTDKAASGGDSKLTILGPSGQRTEFMLNAATRIYGTDNKQLTLNMLKSNSEVSVRYKIAKDGQKEASVIKIVKM